MSDFELILDISKLSLNLQKNGKKINNIPKPIIKWAGGKSKIIDIILCQYPTEIQNYHEIFIGGGSILFAFLEYCNQKIITIKEKIYAYDINQELIGMYKDIQSRPHELYEEIQKYIIIYKNLSSNEQEKYYYKLREQYNNLMKNKTNETLIISALFIILNKLCFRGLYRIGPNGFNVPYGNYKNPEIINLEHLINISKLIAPVVFESLDFRLSIPLIKKYDFVYMDPPYFPEKKTSFVSYSENGFNYADHKELFTMCYTFKERGIYLLMSNSPSVKVSFTSEHGFSILDIKSRRSINSKTPDDIANEILIINY